VHAEWRFSKSLLAGRAWTLWRYRELLPFTEHAEPVTLREGGTPLLDCPALAAWAGVRRVLVKVEGANPTGSFKDRGMTLGVSIARERRAKAVACASTGNTSASMAAYAARAGLPAIVLLPEGKVAQGKVAQAHAHGARLVMVKGDFDAAMKLVEGLAATGEVYLLNSLNPYRLEGQKTLAFEVVEELGWRAPDRIVFPVGNAGNSSAAWKGLRELKALGLLADLPKVTGVQAEGASPLARMFREGRDRPDFSRPAETEATAIRIGHPVNWPKAVRAFRDSKGGVMAVPDAEIFDAQKRLAREAGLFVEPASAAPLAGLKRLAESGEAAAGEEVVLVATGHGLKDPDSALRHLAVPVTHTDATLEGLRRALQ
jgi:threonine synthase